jgi:ankyrin repeat protein
MSMRHLPMTKWLLDNGVTDPNVPDGFGKTALTFAIDKKFPEVEAELRSHGAVRKAKTTPSPTNHRACTQNQDSNTANSL